MYNRFNDLWPKKWPSRENWKRFPEALTTKEKLFFYALLFVFAFSSLTTTSLLYIENTEVVPVSGGVYKEGFIKSTQWLVLNPVYTSRSDTERDIIEVLYSGLMRFDKSGDLVSELISDYYVERERVFNIILKDDLFWSDGEKITADDVLFTVKTIQDPTFNSTLQQSWAGVHVSKISDLEIRFSLDAPSNIFLENLTLKIIPEHIWKDIPAREFPFSKQNIEVVGSGPYRYKSLKKNIDEEIELLVLERNPHYFSSAPYINEVHFLFYKNNEDLLRAKKNEEIDGFAVSGINYPFHGYEFLLPRYFAIIFNLESKGVVGDIKVRQALNYGTNKDSLIQKVVYGEAVDSPLLLDVYGVKERNNPFPYHPEKAKELLSEAGFSGGVKTIEETKVHVFQKDIKEGDQGEEVRALQRCLLSLEEIYPSGEVTGFFDNKTKEAVITLQELYREEILDPWGFEKGTGSVATTTRKKLNELCSSSPETVLSLVVEITTVNQPIMISVAEELRKQWRLIGVDVIITTKDIQSLEREVIRPREYESILFGAALPGIPNPLPLWHSSKAEDPGLNLSGYSNKEADDLMEKIIISDKEEKRDALIDLEEKITAEVPGVFLYNPAFVYFVSEKIKGIESSFITDSSKRFQDIEKWYIKSKRTF